MPLPFSGVWWVAPEATPGKRQGTRKRSSRAPRRPPGVREPPRGEIGTALPPGRSRWTDQFSSGRCAGGGLTGSRLLRGHGGRGTRTRIPKTLVENPDIATPPGHHLVPFAALAEERGPGLPALPDFAGGCTFPSQRHCAVRALRFSRPRQFGESQGVLPGREGAAPIRCHSSTSGLAIASAGLPGQDPGPPRAGTLATTPRSVEGGVRQLADCG